MNEVQEETKKKAKPEKKMMPLSLDIPTEEEFKVNDKALNSVRGPEPLNTFYFEEQKAIEEK